MLFAVGYTAKRICVQVSICIYGWVALFEETIDLAFPNSPCRQTQCRTASPSTARHQTNRRRHGLRSKWACHSTTRAGRSSSAWPAQRGPLGRPLFTESCSHQRRRRLQRAKLCSPSLPTCSSSDVANECTLPRCILAPCFDPANDACSRHGGKHCAAVVGWGRAIWIPFVDRIKESKPLSCPTPSRPLSTPFFPSLGPPHCAIAVSSTLIMRIAGDHR